MNRLPLTRIRQVSIQTGKISIALCAYRTAYSTATPMAHAFPGKPKRRLLISHVTATIALAEKISEASKKT